MTCQLASSNRHFEYSLRSMQLRRGLFSHGSAALLRRFPKATTVRTNRAAFLSTTTPGDGSKFNMPFKSLMAANRGEIAVRIMRAGNELGLRTVGIFSKEDRFTQHRYISVMTSMKKRVYMVSIVRVVCHARGHNVVKSPLYDLHAKSICHENHILREVSK